MDPDAVRRAERVPHGGVQDPSVVDFSANVNPERPDGVARVYGSALSAAGDYPDDSYCDYRVAAAEYVGCEGGQVVPTAGGLAALRLTMATTLSPGDSVLVPTPSFGEYAREARLQGAEPVFVAHDELLDADPADHAMALVCNPNNPTGDAYPVDELRAFAGRCRAAGAPLVVDEAFLGFTDRPSLAGEPGAVVVRSLTKLFGLPGLRAGFAVGPDPVGERLRTARATWNLSTPAAEVGAYCMRQDGFVESTRERVRAERARMADALASDYGVADSAAPFLLLDVGDRDVSAVVDGARERDVVVRDATTFRGLDSHVRVAVRRPPENDRLLAALSGR